MPRRSLMVASFVLLAVLLSFDVGGLTMFPDRSGFGRYNFSYPTCDGLAGRCMQFALRYEF